MGHLVSEKPRVASGYRPEDVDLVLSLYLTVARVLGDYAEDLVVIGGLVPYLLIPQETLEAADRHVGTGDLDLVLEVTLLKEERYKEIAVLLRGSGFAPEKKADTGAQRLQRWVAPGTAGKGIIEFLIPPLDNKARPGTIQHLSGDFGAIILHAGELAFLDRISREVSGTNLQGAKDTRAMWVCGPAAFLVLKAFAHRRRNEPKDAYDIDYLVAGYPGQPASILDRFDLLRGRPGVSEAMELLRNAFHGIDSTGPVDVASFLETTGDENFRRDVAGRLLDFLAAYDARFQPRQ